MQGMADTKFGAGFSFKNWSFDVEQGSLELNYSNPEFGDFTETFLFPAPDPKHYHKIKSSLLAAFDCLHWMAVKAEGLCRREPSGCPT